MTQKIEMTKTELEEIRDRFIRWSLEDKGNMQALAERMGGNPQSNRVDLSRFRNRKSGSAGKDARVAAAVRRVLDDLDVTGKLTQHPVQDLIDEMLTNMVNIWRNCDLTPVARHALIASRCRDILAVLPELLALYERSEK